MPQIELDHGLILPHLDEGEICALEPEVRRCHKALLAKSGAGAEFLGWLNLPSATSDEALQDIEETARGLAGKSDAFISIGIGGSYLGARAGLSFLEGAQAGSRGMEIHFAGHNLSSDELARLFETIDGHDVCLNVISKSGTTTEPALAFRLLRQWLVAKYGSREAAGRIVVTTDASKGALKKWADEEGWRTFVIPGDVGGRFSVLSPVGLLPLAAGGVNVREVIEGAREEEARLLATPEFDKNPAALYAALRHGLYHKGRAIEILAAFNPAFHYIQEWWKQLAGESEGKSGRGLFPASVQYTTDLHSLGQWVQEGPRNLFETFLRLKSPGRRIEIPTLQNDPDGLNYLAGRTMDLVNDKAFQGTRQAHQEGGVPNMTIGVSHRSPQALGALFYFFEYAVALTGYLLEVNPFDQPGVELYKKNMFRLLGKPGQGKG